MSRNESSTARPIAFVSPFTNPQNAYIEHQKALLTGLGFDVRPFALEAVVSGQCTGLLSERNIVLIHWLEDRLFEVGVSERQLRPSGVLGFAAYAAVLAMAKARVIYFIHNHAAHDVKPSLASFSSTAIGLLGRLADLRVVHDPTFAQRYGATYVPHPLYWDPEGPAGPPSSRRGGPLENSTPRFAIMGAVRPYKGIHGVLENWPVGIPLLIAGRGKPDYVVQLRNIIRRRGLEEWVTLEARHLDDAEFVRVLKEQDVLILPHQTGANLVSGAFFEGIGRVKAILARETPFITWAKTRFKSVYSFESEASIATCVAQIIADWTSLQTTDSRETAMTEFGRAACRRAYARLLGIGLAETETPLVETPKHLDAPLNCDLVSK